MPMYRKEKVGSAIQRVVSEAIAQKLNDPRIAPMTTVTRVEMTPDLLIARVFLSVVGDAALETRTIRAVRHARGYLQRLVASAIPLRHCPELRFETDERVKGVRHTMELLAQNLREDPELLGEGAENVEADASSAGEPLDDMVPEDGTHPGEAS